MRVQRVAGEGRGHDRNIAVFAALQHCSITAMARQLLRRVVGVVGGGRARGETETEAEAEATHITVTA